MHHVCRKTLERRFNGLIAAPIFTLTIEATHFPSENVYSRRYSLHTTVELCKDYGLKAGTHFEAVPEMLCVRMVCNEWNMRRQDNPDNWRTK